MLWKWCGNNQVGFMNRVFFVNNEVWISIRVKKKIKKNKHWTNSSSTPIPSSCTPIPKLKCRLYPSIKCAKLELASTPFTPYMCATVSFSSQTLNLTLSKCAASDRYHRHSSKLSAVPRTNSSSIRFRRISSGYNPTHLV